MDMFSFSRRVLNLYLISLTRDKSPNTSSSSVRF